MKHYQFEDEYNAGGAISCADLNDWMKAEETFQASIPPSDPRHWKMFRFARDIDGEEWLEIFWGGYAYSYEMARIQRPEDLLWLVVHLGKKTWEHMTGDRVAALVQSIAGRKGWPPYARAPHPNEAPPAKVSPKAERAKVTHSVRYNVIKRDGYRCRSCGFSVQDGAHLHVDHIVPVSRGGRSTPGNLQTLCTVCNLGKSNS